MPESVLGIVADQNAIGHFSERVTGPSVDATMPMPGRGLAEELKIVKTGVRKRKP